MKKLIFTLLVTTIIAQLNACGGFYFDDGSRAQMLNEFVKQGNVNKAQLVMQNYKNHGELAKERRFQYPGEQGYKSIVGRALELGWLGR